MIYISFYCEKLSKQGQVLAKKWEAMSTNKIARKTEVNASVKQKVQNTCIH